MVSENVAGQSLANGSNDQIVALSTVLEADCVAQRQREITVQAKTQAHSGVPLRILPPTDVGTVRAEFGVDHA